MSTVSINKKTRLKEQSQQLEQKKARIDREIYLIEKKEELSKLIFKELLDGQDPHLCRYSHWIEHDGGVYKVNFSINHATDDEGDLTLTSGGKGQKKRNKKKIQKQVPKRVAKAMCTLLGEYPPMKKRAIVDVIKEVKGFDYDSMYTDFKTSYLEREGPNKGAGTLFKVRK